ncbi:prenyltransferase [Halobacillus rhizosphaerae]|uniref:prenyltransferase n=1 Tax=Halobacillus rhizosphaerae TaxID=3064889 RepID=UPI00398BB244
MTNHALARLKGGWVLLRSIAVISSSVATIVSTVLPLVLYFTIPTYEWVRLFFMLIFGAFLIHGVLTHALNDYVDDLSGTDAHSPGILSGGSRVIQTGLISSSSLWKFAKILMLVLGMVVLALAIFGYYKLAILLAIGLWGSISYSLPPFQFSYRPFIGEWLSTFPSVLFLGLAGAWLALDHFPEWVLQNGIINALFCIAWVMVHHIPDLEADQQASPKKNTSVVWAVEKFGLAYSRLPALLYFGITALCGIWLGSERIYGALGMVVMVIAAMFLIVKMDVTNHEQVSSFEKIILILAMVNAVWLGIFI